MPAEWPTDGDLEQFLQEAGLLTGDLPSSLSGLCEAAVTELGERTGYVPFLANGFADQRLFDAPDGTVVSLRGGAVEVTLVERRYGDTWQTMVRGGDYRVRPVNARSIDKPYTWIELASPTRFRKDAIRVEARWGYLDGEAYNPVPYDLWHAVLRRAAWLSIALLTEGHGIVESVQQDAVKLTFAQGGGGGGAQPAWDTMWEEAVVRYRRVEV